MADFVGVIGRPCKHMRTPWSCEACEIERLRAALPPPEKLELLANYFDLKDAPGQGTEVQEDIREWARRIREVME